MRAPKRHLGALLTGRLAVFVEDIDLAPARSRIGQQAARRQRHEQRAAEIVVAKDEGEPARRCDPAGHLPSAHCCIPKCIPKFARPRVRVAPGVDNAARFGILEVDVIAKRHIHEGSDATPETTGEDYDFADLTLRLRYRAYIFVEYIGGGDDVVIWPRRIA